MTDEDDEVLRLLRAARDKQRGYADFFGWPIDRDREERGVVEGLASSLQLTGTPFFSQISSRGRGSDPPDCEAVTLQGQRVAIEVTELVDGNAVKAFKNGQVYEWAQWSPEQVFAAVSKLLSKKDGRYPELKGGPYPGGYVVVIHTDEPLLSFDVISSYMAGKSFQGLIHISRAFILISYDPQLEYCPAIELVLGHNSKEAS